MYKVGNLLLRCAWPKILRRGVFAHLFQVLIYWCADGAWMVFLCMRFKNGVHVQFLFHHTNSSNVPGDKSLLSSLLSPRLWIGLHHAFNQRCSCALLCKQDKQSDQLLALLKSTIQSMHWKWYTCDYIHILSGTSIVHGVSKFITKFSLN